MTWVMQTLLWEHLGVEGTLRGRHSGDPDCVLLVFRECLARRERKETLAFLGHRYCVCVCR